MKVLAVNCGSSSLKFELLEMLPGTERRLARGSVGRIGGLADIDFACGAKNLRVSRAIADHAQASQVMLDWLNALAGMTPAAVGHRIIHGGEQFGDPALVDEGLLSAVESLGELAPLHNRPALSAIRAVRQIMGTGIPQVAVFDTAFHRTMPLPAGMYAIPLELAEKHHVRRFGFHGLAHRYMAERYAEISGKPPDTVKLITLQLGNGCSATAISAGKSVDTSMGFTPAEGLMMGTRSGNVDPTLAGFLARQEGLLVETIEDWLNRRSGLLGVSGRSADMREVWKAAQQGDGRAALAIDMFCYSARKYIGAYLAVLGGADALVFGGGIGENDAAVRARILSGMEWCGIHIDDKRNREAVGREGRISTDGSALQVYVIPVNEALIIARDTAMCLSAKEVANVQQQCGH
ncbi:MAG: acetate kinase [Chloroflexi bacterium]|nr:acetate kinase [Chloroflexota bacterium]